jgi:putative DNA primase/helicase
VNKPTIHKLVMPVTASGNDAADNFDVPGYLEQAAPLEADKPGTQPLFQLKTIDDLLTAAPPEWLFYGLLPKEGTGLLLGASSVGKSFSALDLSVSAATGRSWHSIECDVPVGVVYVTGEGRMRHRIEALMKHHGVKPDELHRLRVVERPVNLLDESGAQAEVEALVSEIACAASTIDGGVGLIVLDTLNRMAPGGDEGARDMGKVIRGMDMMRDRLGCLVLALHHPGHAEKGRARGHSSLFAAVDVELLVESKDKQAESVRTITANKVRDGAADRVVGAFFLEVVELGQGSKGRPNTSCAVVDCDAPERSAKGDKPTLLEAVFLSAMHEVLSRPGCPVATDIERDLGAKVGQTMAPLKAVKDRLAQIWDGTPDGTRRQRLNRCQDGLYRKGLIGKSESFLWLT